MNPTQERTIEHIINYVGIYDCHKFNPKYGIKEITVEPTSYGTIIIYVVSGRVNDEGTMAAVLCRTHRQIFIGPRGGVRAYGRGNGRKRTAYRGWSDVMIFGYRN